MRQYLGSAFVLGLSCFALLAQTQTPQEEKCVVTGRVMNALTGDPVKKATVRLHFANHKPNEAAPVGYAGTSEVDGSFRFEGINPGEYSLTASHPGFLDTSYGSKGPNQSGTNLVLTAGQQMTELTLKILPQGTIIGRVTDEDGDPVQMQVNLFKITWQHGKRRFQPWGGWQSDDRGEYRLTGVYPGRYYICAVDAEHEMGRYGTELPAMPGKPDVRPVRTCYPDATSLENAAPVTIAAGQNQDGIDIHVRSLPTFHIRGRIGGALNPDDIGRLSVTIMSGDAAGFVGYFRSNIDKKGTFDISGVAPGSYFLNLFSMSGRFRPLGRTPVEVAGSDVNGVVLNVVPSGTLRGRIQMEGASGGQDPSLLSGMNVFLRPVDENMMGYVNSNPSHDGTVMLENVSPQKYYLHVVGLPDGAYVKSVRLGQQEVLGKELDFTEGVSGELTIVLRNGAAQVNGTVQLPHQGDSSSASTDTKKSDSPPTASIVLIPEVLRTDGTGIEYGNLTQAGTFSIKNVTPGHYRAYAFEELNHEQTDNPDFLKQIQPLGTELDLHENDNQQIQLSLIPATDTQRVLAQLGIEAQ